MNIGKSVTMNVGVQFQQREKKKERGKKRWACSSYLVMYWDVRLGSMLVGLA